jgi:anti-sigma factor RsiW
MADHPDASELAAFVTGELAGPPLARFEAHVASCDGCAAQLAREARIELALIDLGGELAAAAGRGLPGAVAAVGHPDATELAAFVAGELAGPPLARFEAHIASCDDCAAQLAREARIELALIELAAAPAARRRRGLRAAVGAVVIAAAAAALLVVRLDRAQLESSPWLASASCESGRAPAECARPPLRGSSARRAEIPLRGSPDLVLTVAPGRRPSAGPSSSPFPSSRATER